MILAISFANPLPIPDLALNGQTRVGALGRNIGREIKV